MVKLNKTLRSSTIVKRKQQPQSTQKNKILLKDRLVIDRTCPKQRLLEQSFARLNDELAKKDSELNRSGRNIIMEILNIHPVIDLSSVDNESSKEGSTLQQDPDIKSDTISLDSPTVVEVNNKNANLVGILKPKRIRKRGKRRLPKVVRRTRRHLEQMIGLNISTTTSTPDSSKPSTSKVNSQVITERDAQALNNIAREIVSLKKQKAEEQKIKPDKTSGDNTDNATSRQVKNRNKIDQLKEYVRQLKLYVSEPTSKNIENTPSTPTTSNGNNIDNSLKYTNKLLNICSQQQHQGMESNDYNKFISRFRFEHRSIQVDLSKNYTLVGLRYLQDILGNDLISASDQFIRIPLTVVSFNVLCQHYMKILPHLYNHLKGSRYIHATWNSRKEKLQEEFNRIDADIFCLQEVQDVYFEEFYQPYFLNRNFQGIFTRKTGGSATPDGCAIFWRKSKLTLLRLNQVSFNLNCSLMEHPNVGQIAIFGLNESLNSSTAICVSNTHIFFNMKMGTIKLSQIAYLLGHMRKMENEFLTSRQQDKKYNFVGHILCGDFNIEPSSPLHRFIIDQIINLRTPSCNMALNPCNFVNSSSPIFGLPLPIIPLHLSTMSLSNNCEIVDVKDPNFNAKLFKHSSGFLTHGFSFASVYEHFNIVGEPEISSYHFDQSTPDFIFYSVPKVKCQPGITINSQEQLIYLGLNNDEQKKYFSAEGFIQLRQRLSLPTLAELDKYCGKLPNEQYGSDHLLICAKFDILCPLIYFLMFYYYY